MWYRIEELTMFVCQHQYSSQQDRAFVPEKPVINRPGPNWLFLIPHPFTTHTPAIHRLICYSHQPSNVWKRGAG
jgi:hypothetical protein